MENFRFILEGYNREKRNRYICPSCGKPGEFTRYIDTANATVQTNVGIIIPRLCTLRNIPN